MPGHRKYKTGPGFVSAEPCPDCFHTKCGEDCVCNCDAARAEFEADALRSQLAQSQAEVARLREALGASRVGHDFGGVCRTQEDSTASGCDCGADWHNARIDAALATAEPKETET